MDFIYRLIVKRIIYILVGLAFGFVMTYFNTAKAEYPAKTVYYINNHTPRTYYATPRSACDGWLRRQQSTATGSTVYTFVSSTATNCLTKNSGFTSPDNNGILISNECPGPVYSSNSNQCPGVAPAPSGCLAKKGIKQQYSLSTSPTGNQCLDSCSITSGDAVCILPDSPEQRCYISGTFTGDSCAIPLTEPATTPEFDCVKEGKTSGTVNGVVVCVAIGTAGATPVTKTQDQASQNITSSGTIDTTKKVSESGGTVTTSSISTAPNGIQTTSVKTQDIASFCEENPNSTICKSMDEEGEESVFGGSCAGFTCDGDAIQCAIAKEQHTKNCKLFDEQTDLTSEGQSMIESEGNNPAAEENREIVDLEGMITEGNNIGSGTFQDKVIPLKGAGITLPFSKLNDIMQLLGGFLLAGAYLNASRIVGVR